MRHILKNLWLLLLAVTSLWQGGAFAQVEVQLNQQQYQFTDNPRLTDVLKPVALTARWYWPAASLYQLDDAMPEQLRTKLLQQLTDLQQAYVGDSAMLTTLAAIAQQVQSWQLAKRIVLSIDYDAAMIEEARNPRFDNGRYLLQLTLRPNQLYVFGAVTETETITHQSATSIAGYADSLNYTDAARRDEVVLLQPDAISQVVGMAAWNSTHIEAMPGSQLFVPIKTSLFDGQLEEVNKNIVALAVHRVLP